MCAGGKFSKLHSRCRPPSIGFPPQTVWNSRRSESLSSHGSSQRPGAAQKVRLRNSSCHHQRWTPSLQLSVSWPGQFSVRSSFSRRLRENIRIIVDELDQHLMEPLSRRLEALSFCPLQASV